MPSITTSWLNDLKRTGRYWLGRNAGEGGAVGLDAIGLSIATIIWYVVSTYLNDSTPSLSSHGNAGWLNWWDQGWYLKTTSDLAHGQLKPSAYWYGYPILGVPFYWLLPRHPYFIPNLAMVVAMAGVFYAACRLYVSRLESLVLVYVFIWLDSFLRDECLVIPWNTMPAYAAFFLCIYLLILKPSPGRLVDFAICAIACGIAMFARPTEIAALGIIYLFGLVKLQTWKERMWAGGWMGAIVLLVGGVTLGLNYHFYQGFESPYMRGESAKANLGNFGLKLYQFLFDARFLTGGASVPADVRPAALLTRYPEFLLVIPGFLFLLKDRGWIAWGFILGLLVELGIYLVYNPFNNMPYAWRYGQWHYIAWMLPWLGFVTYLSVRQTFFHLPRGLFFGALLFPLFVACVIGFKAVPLASATVQSGENLRLETSVGTSLYAANLTVLKSCRIEDIRLLFHQSPLFDGTEASKISLITVAVNGAGQEDMFDRSVSQDDNTWHISFLAHGLSLKVGDKIAIQFHVRDAPDLDQAQLVGVEFAPMQSIRDYFQMN